MRDQIHTMTQILQESSRQAKEEPSEAKSPKIQAKNHHSEFLSADQQALHDRFLNQHNVEFFISQQSDQVRHWLFQQIHSGVEIYDEIVEVDKSVEKPEVKSLVFQHLAGGGLRGLQVLSLAECRNLSDQGLQKLSQLRYLKKLSLLWCNKIEDEGLSFVANNFTFLEDLDLGGTNITSNGLRDLVNKASNLKSVSIMGCKKLNNSDDQILLKKQINCQGVDDVFRFHLLPELSSSDLPQITKSVLKTRSTLGLNKVYKYLFKRLLQMKTEDLLRSEHESSELYNEQNIDLVVPEEKIEIMCNGHYLKPTLQLKEVREMYWNNNISANQSPDLLILHYTRKQSKIEKTQIMIDQVYQSQKSEKGRSLAR